MKMENSEKENNKLKICDLPINDIEKKILALCVNPTNIPKICAKLDLAYSTINQKILVLKAKGFLINDKTLSGKSITKLSNKLEV